jgi:hypothetical protein
MLAWRRAAIPERQQWGDHSMHATTTVRFVPVSIALLVAAMAMALVLAAPVSADASLAATLTGAEEVPGPGDAGGSGTAAVGITTASGEICVTLEWTISDGTASAAHIHQAPDGTAGPVVLPLFTTPDDNGFFQDCFTDMTLAPLLEATPANYYVNIHSATYPDGAVRGQLAVAPAATASPTPVATTVPNAAMAPAEEPVSTSTAIAVLFLVTAVASAAFVARRALAAAKAR